MENGLVIVLKQTHDYLSACIKLLNVRPILGQRREPSNAPWPAWPDPVSGSGVSERTAARLRLALAPFLECCDGDVDDDELMVMPMANNLFTGITGALRLPLLHR